MGTAERSGAPAQIAAARVAVQGGAGAQDLDIPSDTRQVTREPYPAPAAAGARGASAGGGPTLTSDSDANAQRPYYRPLWVEEPAKRRRLPDPVRTAAVRAVLITAVTLIQAMVAFLCTLAGSWLAFPMVLTSVASTVAATWCVLDVWVTRQVWNQRHGVVSTPSSTARALRRERRRTRRQVRATARAQERIRRPGGAGWLSHS
jgi:hypothetical protein